MPPVPNFPRKFNHTRLFKGIIAFLLLSLVWFWQPMAPAWAAAQPERVPLTLELLQERLKNPTQSDGFRTIDLRRLVIDLRPENEGFRDQFYRLLQTQLQKSGSPIGLDLSYSLIQGELKISDLGLRAPLYGQALSPIFTEAERSQLQRDRRRLSQLSQLSRSLLIQPQITQPQITIFRGPLTLTQTRFEGFVNCANTFFLGRVEAQGTTFTQDADWSESRFSRPFSFAGASYRKEARFRSSIFFEQAGFNQVQFQGNAIFQGSEFHQMVNFSQVNFQRLANFTRVQWRENADFAQAYWQAQVLFDKGNFARSLFLTDATFEGLATFREAQFNQPVNLRGANIQQQIDFGDASFATGAYLNVAGLQFNSEAAKLLGDPGQIGRIISVPTLQGNETLLRNLVRNFRSLEQIPDANQVEYTTEKLRLRDLRQRLWATNLNTASRQQLQQIGFSPAQVQAIAENRTQQPFRSLSEVLKLDSIDLATYVKVRDRAIAIPARRPSDWAMDALHWMGLSLLLLLTLYGTSFWLVFGVGMVAIAYFGSLFWLVDRLRLPKTLPALEETLWVLVGFSLLSGSGLYAIFRTGDRPELTLICLSLLIVPIPIALLLALYQQVKSGDGQSGDLLNSSYFVEDGSQRQLRFLIGRLPNIPRYVFFRDRFAPLLWDRRWNWLNYFDFSLNNLLKFGFNDIRLRDQQMPGLITALAWYQWTLGILYFALLLWTLSRTIPGLNLLIYFK